MGGNTQMYFNYCNFYLKIYIYSTLSANDSIFIGKSSNFFLNMQNILFEWLLCTWPFISLLEI